MTQVKLIDLTEGMEPTWLGRSATDLLRGLPEISISQNTSLPSWVAGKPIAEDVLEEALGYCDCDCEYGEWIKFIAAIGASPISDSPDRSKRRALAHRFSRGELDREHRYDTILPFRYDGPEAVDRVFDSMLPKETGIGVGSIISTARKNGYRGNVYAQSAAQTFADYIRDAGPIPFSDVFARDVLPVQELVQGLIERGVPTFLSAPGGSHKSRLALQWGLCIDAGAQIYGRTVESATFVYLSAEDHADEVARRAQTIARRLELPRDGAGKFWDRVGKVSALATLSEGGGCELTPFYSELSECLTSIEGHKFVVLDSTYNFVCFQGKGKIDEGAVNAFIVLLQRLCNETNSTLLVLWHPSQSGQERGDASGWSVAWHNAPRARLSVTPAKDTEDAFELRVEKRNHGPKGKPLALYWSDGVLLPRGETDAAEQNVRFMVACERIAKVAAEQGAPIQKQRRLNKWMLDEIEQAVGYRPSQRDVKEALALALRERRLRYVSGGNRQSAGYYPFDLNQATELAIAAKNRKKGRDSN